MATAGRTFFCEMRTTEPAAAEPLRLALGVRSAAESPRPDKVKIALQPRLCTLRSYGSDRAGVIKPKTDGGGGADVDASPFFEALSEYIESSRNSHDFEIISGRLAMMVFPATVMVEVATGNSVFRKTDLQGIAEAAGVCAATVACAATFAWFTSARGRVGKMFTVGCNKFIDSLIDHVVDGLFYENELSD